MDITRKDDFRQRRKHLKKLSDKELKNRFWKLAYQVVEPLINLAKTHTSPSIERSVLLRMGFSSLEAGKIVSEIHKKNLLGHGAGNIVWQLAKKNGVSIHSAGNRIAHGYKIESLFQKEKIK